VQIRGVQVRPGDLVCADEAGVAFVPREQAAAVLEVARNIDAADSRRKADIDSGASIADLISRKYK
jgi:regulator of RNase E activity RraA